MLNLHFSILIFIQKVCLTPFMPTKWKWETVTEVKRTSCAASGPVGGSWAAQAISFSIPRSIEGRDSIPSFFSHPLYFLFSSRPLVPTDNRKKMKGGKGALCVSLPLPAYFSGFILVVWPCLSLSYYCCLLLPQGHPYAVSACANMYLCMHIHTLACYAQMHWLMSTRTLSASPSSSSLWLYFGRIPLRVAWIILFVHHKALHSPKG